MHVALRWRGVLWFWGVEYLKILNDDNCLVQFQIPEERSEALEGSEKETRRSDDSGYGSTIYGSVYNEAIAQEKHASDPQKAVPDFSQPSNDSGYAGEIVDSGGFAATIQVREKDPTDMRRCTQKVVHASARSYTSISKWFSEQF